MSRDELNEVERRVLAALTTGRVVDVRAQETRTVRAEALAGLLMRPGPDAVALRLRGARVVGHFNLGGCRVPIPVDLRDCEFTGKVLLAKVNIPELSMKGSVFPHGISGREMRTEGALNLTDCRLEQRLYLKRLRADIVYLDRSHVHGTGPFAVNLRGAEIAQELYCRDGFQVFGGMNLYGAKVGGQVLMDRARIEGTAAHCVHANGLDVGQDLRLRDAIVTGPINLAKARVGDNLELSAAALSNPGGMTINASMIEVGENVMLDRGFSAVGEVNFFLGRVAGRIEVDGAWLRNPGAISIDLSRTDIGQSVLLNHVAAEGAVHIYGAKIVGQLSMNNTTVVNPDGNAVHGVQCAIGQSLWIDDGSRLDGVLDLTNASVGNRFRMSHCRIRAIRATDLVVDILDDDPDCWPADSHIVGLAYKRLPEDSRGYPNRRIAWLKRLLWSYSPQPYTQLISVYKDIGSSTGVRAVTIAREVARRGSQTNPLLRIGNKVWGAVLRWTIGFGHAPWRSFPWMLALFITAWTIYANAPRGSFTPVDQEHEKFHPALHALDSLLPVLRLDTGTQWIAHGPYAWWEAAFAASGWFLGLVVTAGVAGVFRRE